MGKAPAVPARPPWFTALNLEKKASNCGAEKVEMGGFLGLSGKAALTYLANYRHPPIHIHT